MKRTLWAVTALALIALGISAAAVDLQRNADHTGDEITISLNDVPLADALGILIRNVDLNIVFNPTDPKLKGQRITANLKDQPFLPSFRSMLAPFGMVLIPNPGQRDSYTILSIDSDTVAEKCRSAERAVSLAESVLEQIEKGDLASAKELLRKSIAANKETLKTVLSAKDAGGKASAPSGSPGETKIP